MKAISLILKIILLILAAIWGIGCGILFPVVILSSDGGIVADELATDPVFVVWLVTASAGFVIPAILTICRFYKTASVLSLLGFGGILYVYARFAELYVGSETNGPTGLYLPCIFMTILILLITAIENRGRIKAYLDKKSEEDDRPAPSIFGDSEKKQK